MSEAGDNGQASTGRRRTQGEPPPGGGRGPRRGRFRELVAWRESALAGVGALLAGLVLAVVVLRLFAVGEDLAVGVRELAVLVTVEGVGVTVNRGELAATLSAYGTLDSDLLGVGPAVHMLVPAAVVLAGGYILAGRHIEAGATERPRDVVIAGGSLAVWFTLALAVVTLATVATAPTRISVDVVQLLVVGVLYSAVLAATGGAVRSRARLVSSRGLLAGVGAFVVAVLAWAVGTNPFADRAASGVFDFGGTVELLDVLRTFVLDHGIGETAVLPPLFALVVWLGFGAGLAYAAGRGDPIAGAGEGARLGVGYAAAVSLVVVGQILALTGESWQAGTWADGQGLVVNELLAAAPRTILLVGVVYPVTVAAVGGAVGAVVYRRRQRRRATTRHE